MEEQIIMYFDKEGNECKPDDAVEVIVQDVDEDGKLIKESKFYRV